MGLDCQTLYRRGRLWAAIVVVMIVPLHFAPSPLPPITTYSDIATMQRAVRQGEPWAMIFLAERYRDGNQVAQDYAHADRLYRRALTLVEQHYGRSHPLLIPILAGQASLWQKQGDRILYNMADWPRIIAVYRRLLEINRRVCGTGHRQTGLVLDRLARSYHWNDQFRQAEAVYRRALVILERRCRRTDPAVASTMANLAWTLTKGLRDYAGAELILHRALALAERHLGPDHLTTAMVAEKLAWLSDRQCDYPATIALLQRVSAIRRKKLGDTSIELAKTLQNMGYVLQQIGDYGPAERCLHDALAICRRRLPKDHQYTAVVLDFLGCVVTAKGDWASAAAMHRQSLAVFRREFGRYHFQVGATLYHLGWALLGAGDYAGAEKVFRELVEIRRKICRGQDNPHLASAFENMAIVAQHHGDYARAEQLHRRCLEMRTRSLGQDHHFVGHSLRALAEIAMHHRDYRRARQLLHRAYLIQSRNVGERPQITKVLRQLGQVCFVLGDYAQAEDYYRRSCRINRNKLPAHHPDLAMAQHDLATVLLAVGRRQPAIELLRQSFRHHAVHLRDIFPLLTERQQQEFLNKDFHRALNTYLSALDQPQVYDNLLAYRGVTAYSLRQRRLIAADRQTGELPKQLHDARRYYAYLYLNPNPKLPPQVYRQVLDQALARKEQLERQLAHCLPHAAQKMYREQGVTVIRQNLAANQAIVDFVYYERIADWRRPDNRHKHLAAFVVTRERTVVRVELGAADAIDQAATAFRQSLLAAGGGADRYRAAGQRLYRLIWQPLVEYLAGKQLIHIVSDGKLAVAPLDAMVVPGTHPPAYLTERVAIAYLASPWDLVEYRQRPPQPGAGFLCLGAVAYGQRPPMVGGDKAGSTSRIGEKSQWRPLPGAQKEAEELVACYRDRFPRAEVKFLTGVNASETALYHQCAGKKYLHFATHGYYRRTGAAGGSQHKRGVKLLGNGPAQDSQPSTPASPLLDCGLVLAGANLPNRPGDIEDGILTGEELAGYDLRGCDLVVLSACESGIGAEQRGQGIAGLRLAAHIAGARTMLSSLWKIDDADTRLFMKAFYRRLWHDNMGKLQALRATRREWIDQDRRQRRGDQANIWAAFIISGQP